MDLEGLKCWVRADASILEGYRVLFDAVERQGLSATWQNYSTSYARFGANQRSISARVMPLRAA